MPHGNRKKRDEMQVPNIAADGCTIKLLSGRGKSILHVLIEGEAPLPVHCGGLGICGNCRILFGGEPGPPLTTVEKRHLVKEEIRAGVRLACQVKPKNGRQIRIIKPPSITKWRTIDEQELPLMPFPNMATGKFPGAGRYGLSIDLGTTHIRAALWDLAKQVRLAGKSCLNPHNRFGADILQRLDASVRSAGSEHRMKQLMAGIVSELVEDLRSDGHLQNGIIGSVVVVGNTAMLTLLAGNNQGLLLNPLNWTREIDVQPQCPDRLKSAMGIPCEASLHLVPAIAGFIGSDLPAAIIYTGMCRDARRTLLIDFGTNSEIAFWDGESLWVTSAAGGPAFDGCGISCGMPAAPGAISRIQKGTDGSTFACDVIGNDDPKGICGSGIVDAIALLLEGGALRPSGKFNPGFHMRGFRFQFKKRDMVLKPIDVDVFQRAKAAIAAGVSTVLHQAMIDPGDIERIHVCGAFGRHLSLVNAKAVGLLPDLTDDRFVISGNAALGGCERLLTAEHRQFLIDDIRDRVRTVDLARSTFFADAFAAHLFLRAAGFGIEQQHFHQKSKE